MALCSTVPFPESVVDLETVKRPLVACLVGNAWLSELCVRCLNRPLVACLVGNARLYLDYVGEASIKEHPLCSVRQVTLNHYKAGDV
jgi:hypothetical protein